MALRAGYQGFKKLLPGLKLFRPGCLGIDNVELSKTFFPRSEQSLLGAKNLLENKATSGTTAEIVTTVNDDGTMTLNAGTTSGNYYKVIQGGFANDQVPLPSWLVKGREYIISDGNEDDKPYMGIWFYDSNKTIIGSPVYQSSFIVPDNAAYYLIALYMPGSTTITQKTIYPMIRLATDPDPTFAPYAKTNQQLTADVSTLNGSASDQKTAINAIITAATEAADFAAFKTAMGAITPVTRSIQVIPETREEIIEPVEEVKKTTRKKSTAKADTEKEGEK